MKNAMNGVDVIYMLYNTQMTMHSEFPELYRPNCIYQCPKRKYLCIFWSRVSFMVILKFPPITFLPAMGQIRLFFHL